MRNILPPVILWIASLAAGIAAATASENPLQQGWDNLDGFLFNEAHTSFSRATGFSGSAERERKLGEAVTLLNVQPRTGGNISRATALLQELADAKISDDTDTFARFFLARTLEMHQAPADLAKARAIYLDLLESRPGTPLAEYGASKIALIDLYDNIPAAEFARRVGELEKLEPLLKTSQGRREFHANIGIACAEQDGPPDIMLRHLLAADKEGFTQWQTESIVWVLIADAAEKGGDKELARQYYQKFTGKYKRDNRYYTIQERLKRLTADQ